MTKTAKKNIMTDTIKTVIIDNVNKLPAGVLRMSNDPATAERRAQAVKAKEVYFCTSNNLFYVKTGETK